MENRGVKLRALIDIVGAFDSTSVEIITRAAKWHGLGDMIFRIGCSLGGRKSTAILAGDTLEGSGQGLSAGSVRLPLLWSMVMDEINENGCCTLGYADDIAILISGNFVTTISDLIQEALRMVQQQCDRTQLSISKR